MTRNVQSSARRYDPVRTVAERVFRSEGQPAYNRYSRMADAWTALAKEQDWLDGEIPPVKISALRSQSA